VFILWLAGRLAHVGFWRERSLEKSLLPKKIRGDQTKDNGVR